MTHFLVIRQDLLELIDSKIGKACKQAAAALLNFFKHQRSGWLTLNLTQLQETLLHQWGRETIRKAAAALANCGLIERKHHRMNGRAWQYRATVTPEKVTTTPDAATVTSDSAASIYKDPLKDPQQNPCAARENLQIDREEIEQAKVEIEALRINPAVMREVLKNFANFKGAIARTKQAINDNWCKNPTGLLLSSLKSGAQPEQKDIPHSLEKAALLDIPTGLVEWVNENAKDYFYSSIHNEWRVVYKNGTQQAWSEVKP
jgi:hypothetical protein